MGYERHLGGTKCKHCRAVMADPLCICGEVHGYQLCEPPEGHVCEVPEDGIDLRPHLRSIGATYAVVGDAHRVELIDDEPGLPPFPISDLECPYVSPTRELRGIRNGHEGPHGWER